MEEIVVETAISFFPHLFLNGRYHQGRRRVFPAISRVDEGRRRLFRPIFTDFSRVIFPDGSKSVGGRLGA